MRNVGTSLAELEGRVQARAARASLAELEAVARSHAIHSPEEAARYLRAKLERSGDPTAVAAFDLIVATY